MTGKALKNTANASFQPTESKVAQGKYTSLSQYLTRLACDEWRATFAEVEAVLGFPLPGSALQYAAWWANNRQDGRHSMAWLDVNWRTEELDLATQRVIFRRSIHKAQDPVPVAAQPKLALPPDPIGNTLRCSVFLTWAPVGLLAVDEAGKLVFPKVTTVPAIYEFRVRYSDGRRSRYVGETANLRQRFSGYRNAAETQDTNVRLQRVFTEAMAAGGMIEVSAVFENPWLEDASGRRQVVLSSQSVRRLMENVAILTGGGTEVEALNLAT
ncbi:DUF7662 domain-containing protein [Azospirillum brasilense]|uniref:DUF7662 domain-containing protein n=1 Tax=Azospirillum brasilense TaxID=192 RepID=UPI001EDB8A02|nr:hypothetical protein [Azospirillum brasilense]UKJ74240.1 hypothetical protein H1Q64_06555 [Azospirillum brasilense]